METISLGISIIVIIVITSYKQVPLPLSPTLHRTRRKIGKGEFIIRIIMILVILVIILLVIIMIMNLMNILMIKLLLVRLSKQL